MNVISPIRRAKGARKAISVVAVLALLAALLPAVPAWANVTSVSITSPTQTTPVYVKSGDTFTVQGKVYLDSSDQGQTCYINFYVGTTQVKSITATVYDEGGSNPDTVTLNEQITVPSTFAEGNYDLKVEGKLSGQANWVSATQAAAVVVDNTPPAVPADTLTAPNGGEQISTGASYKIRWNTGKITDPNLESNPITLYYSSDGGNTWTQMATNEANDGTYDWSPVPNAVSTNCKVKIEAKDKAGNKASDVSNGTFTIYGIDNTPPTVAMSFPANNGYVGGTTTLKATASDNESGIAEVKFEYSADGSTWNTIGASTSQTGGFYQLTWNVVASGLADGAKIQVRAVATNGVGAQTTSAASTNVTVDNSAPAVSLTAPVTGGYLGATYTVKATASDNQSGITSVQFEYSTDGNTWNSIGAGTLNPPGSNNYDYTWTLPGGLADGTTGVQVRAKATNGAGATAISNVATGLTVDKTNPTIQNTTLSAPNGGEVWKVGEVRNITWNKNDITDANLLPNPVSLYYSADNGANWVPIAENLANTGSYAWTVSGVPTNSAKVKIVARDKAGNQAEDASNETFYVWAQDTTPPAVSITSPAAGAKLKGTVTLTATANDPESGIDIDSVEFAYSTDNGTSWSTIGSATRQPDGTYQYSSWNTSAISAKDVLIRATAKNGVGASNIATVTVTVDNSPPTVNLTAPVTSGYIGTTCTIKANASDNESGIAKVKFEYSTDGTNWSLIGEDTTAPYEVTWNVPLADGTTGVHVKATATNGAGGENTSTATNLTVDKTPPTIKTNTLASPNGSERWPRGSLQIITWTAGDIADDHLAVNPVSLYYSTDGGANWTLIATGVDNTTGTYNWVVPAVTSDKCRIKIEVRDQAGNVASDISDADFTIYAVEQNPPDVTVNSPNGGESYTASSSVVITWTATDDTTPRADLKVNLYYSTDGGANWTLIAANEANDGAYAWTVPNVSSDRCLVKVEARDAVGNVGYDISDRTFSIAAPAAPPAEVTTVTLQTGWNLVSLPLIPNDPSIEAVLADALDNVVVVWGYDAATGSWSSYAPGAPSDLAEMRDGRGYWVRVNADDSFAVDGVVLPLPPQVPPSYGLVPGWNLIGFKSTVPKKASEYLAAMAGKYTVIYGFDAATQRFYQVTDASPYLEPGKGYWIAATAEGYIYP